MQQVIKLLLGQLEKKLLATAFCVQQKHVFHVAKPIIYSCAKACACIQHIVLPSKHFPFCFHMDLAHSASQKLQLMFSCMLLQWQQL